MAASSTFYHGTSLAAALSIQRAGFDVARSGSNAGRRLGAGVYFSPDIHKAMHYASDKLHGGCILQLEVELGNCYQIRIGDADHTSWRDHEPPFDSAHAPEGALGGNSLEEFCIRDPRRIRQLSSVTLGNTGKAGRANFTVVHGAAGPPEHWSHWGRWVSWLEGPPPPDWEFENGAQGSGKWHPYSQLDADKLSASYGDATRNHEQLMIGGNSYAIDLLSLTQVNTNTGFARAIRCNSAAVRGKRSAAAQARACVKMCSAWAPAVLCAAAAIVLVALAVRRASFWIASVSTTASGPEDDSGEYQWIDIEELAAQEMLEQEVLEETMAGIQSKIAGTSTHHFLFSYFTLYTCVRLGGLAIIGVQLWIVLRQIGLLPYIRGFVARRGIPAAALPRMGVVA